MYLVGFCAQQSVLVSMDLQGKLALYHKQQAKLQTSLSKTGRPAGQQTKPSTSASKKPLQPPPSTQPVVPFANRFSFTNDQDKLQQIATIRKSPVGAQIKRVLGVLLETRQNLLPEEINDLCYVDVKANKGVFESLQNNPKVAYDGRRFCYKSKHDLKNKAELLRCIRTDPHGIPLADLKDSYVGVEQDVQELKAAGEVWVLTNSDSQEDVVYPNDPNVKIKVDEDLKQLVRGVELPREFVDVERELMKTGMKPASSSARRNAMAGIPRSEQKPKEKPKRRESKRTKYTNAHIPEIFSIPLNPS